MFSLPETETRRAAARASDDRFLAEAQARLRAITDRRVVEAAARYVRERDLPKLLRVKPEEIEGVDSADIILGLSLALCAEQNAAKTNHWSRSGMAGYRAMSLRIALHAERERADRKVAA